MKWKISILLHLRYLFLLMHKLCARFVHRYIPLAYARALCVLILYKTPTAVAVLVVKIAYYFTHSVEALASIKSFDID